MVEIMHRLEEIDITEASPFLGAHTGELVHYPLRLITNWQSSFQIYYEITTIIMSNRGLRRWKKPSIALKSCWARLREPGVGSQNLDKGIGRILGSFADRVNEVPWTTP